MLAQKQQIQMAYWLNSCRIAQDWNRVIALEYWLQPALAAMGIGTFSSGLFAVASNGWVNTGTIIGVAGSGADFPLATEYTYDLASDKGTHAHFAIDTAGDLLNSPALFGDPTHMAAVAELAGMDRLPDFVILDTWSTFAVVSNNETASGLGFVEAGGAASVANDHLACFFSDGTNFKLRSGAATSAALMTADTNPHRFRVVLNRLTQLAEAYIDDMASQLGSIALEKDLFPCSFGGGVLASTGANFIHIGPTRVRYSWTGW